MGNTIYSHTDQVYSSKIISFLCQLLHIVQYHSDITLHINNC